MQNIIANFRCSLNAPSTTCEICPLCYAQMKFNYPRIVHFKFEDITLKGFVVTLISFNF